MGFPLTGLPGRLLVFPDRGKKRLLGRLHWGRMVRMAQGWLIFRHSFNLLMENLEQAFRLSFLLYLVQSSYAIYLFFNPAQTTELEGMQVMVTAPEDMLPTVFFGFVAIVGSVWIAVAWHRFVLNGEVTGGWLPEFRGSLILGYLGRSIMIGVLVIFGVIVLSIPISIIAVGLPGLAGLMTLVMIGAGAYFFFRLGIMLPAAALGEKLTLADAWDATSGKSDTILTLALIVVGGSVLIQLPSQFNDAPDSTITLVYTLVVNWFATIIGISVLTTLYGHYVEQRPIK
jgi:hypothetical protein